MSDTILYRVEEHIATITLNRPDKRNAFNAEMFDACRAAFERADRDEAVRVIVLTGAGQNFCAGGDVSDMGREIMPVAQKALLDKMQSIPRLVARIDKPVIAMINGDAVGGGLDVALMCDVRIASEKARLSEAYVRLGLVPGDGGAYFLPRLVGITKALELLLTGDFIDAREAERIGMVTRTVAPEQLAEQTYKLARRMASNPPLAVQMTKRLVYQSVLTDLGTALDLVSTRVVLAQQTADHKEAIAAFREKRRGNYVGQ